MKKGILLMEIPERCSMCPFKKEAAEKYAFCSAPGKGIDDQIEEYMRSTPVGKPDWCPVKEIPERKPDKALGKWLEFNSGWNACVNAIEEESNV